MAGMEYKEIPYVNKPVSRLFYGTAADPFLLGEECDELLDSVYALGITAFDTAREYALSENTLGKWLEKRGNRDDIVLLSKCGHPDKMGNKRVNRKEIKNDFQRSCEALKTNYIDIYLLHRDDPEVEVDSIVETFNELYARNGIGAFGGSNWDFIRIEAANEYAYKYNLIPFTVSSPYFGLARQVEDPWVGGCVSISGKENEKAREWYQKEQMPIIAYSSLGRGLFSGKLKGSEFEKAGEVMDSYALKGYAYPENFERLKRVEEIAKQKGYTIPQIAMAWIYQQKLNTFAVVSTTSAARMQENVNALHIELTEKEILYLDLVEDEYRQDFRETKLVMKQPESKMYHKKMIF